MNRCPSQCPKEPLTGPGIVTGSFRVMFDCPCGWPVVQEYSFERPGQPSMPVHCRGCNRNFLLSIRLIEEVWRDFVGGYDAAGLTVTPPTGSHR